jgi:hypothetical protein
MKSFIKYKQQLTPTLGTGVTNSMELDLVGRSLFGDLFGGVKTQDQDIDESKRYFVYNLDTKGMPGSHWVGVVLDEGEVIVYDSFGRNSKKILPILSSKYDITDTDPDPEQVESEYNCGLNVMAWLLVYDKLGRAMAESI